MSDAMRVLLEWDETGYFVEESEEGNAYIVMADEYEELLADAGSYRNQDPCLGPDL